jgi:hypothetical protein
MSYATNKYRPILEAMAVGLTLGFADANHAGDADFSYPAYFLGGILIGLIHAGRCLPCWPILGMSLYVVHVVAIALGQKPPFVEENYRFAEQCYGVFLPSGFGLMAGAALRVFLASVGSFHRKSGPPVRFLPRTTRDLVVMVACVGIGLGCLCRMFSPPTVYAPGYDEAKFRTIHEGMTADQVASIMGQPLEKQTWPDGQLVWKYSDQFTYLSDFDRRWVHFSGGTVQRVDSFRWYD